MANMPENFKWSKTLNWKLLAQEILLSRISSSFDRMYQSEWKNLTPNSSQSHSTDSAAISNELLIKSRKYIMSDAYPLVVSIVKMTHKGGTKSYDMFEIINAQKKSLTVLRWGKVGSVGQYKTVAEEPLVSKKSTFEKTFDAKLSNGYTPKSQDNKSILNFSALTDYLGAVVMSKIGSDNLKFIDPAADMTGVRRAEPARLDENGRIDRSAERKAAELAQAEVQAAKAEAQRQEIAAQKEAYNSNPDFGMF